MNYAKELEFAKDLALEAGGIMRRYFREEQIGHEWKDDDTPLTIADTKINSLVIEQVKQHYPEHGVLGEEESYKQERKIIWVVDPIDGTVPFSLGIPASMFAMALVDRTDGQPILAVTYDPFLDEMYTARKRQGSYCNEVKIKTSEQAVFRKNYFSVGTGYIDKEGRTIPYGRLAGLVRQAEGRVMNYISGVYLAMRIARGQMVGQIAAYSSPWDCAASALIVEEAGGVVCDMNGKKRRFDEFGDGFVMASNQKMMDKMLHLIEKAYENSRD